MTVCIGSLFRWNYGNAEEPDFGVGALSLSDRMITAGDVEYEPPQFKVAYVNDRTVVLIAGNYSIHSLALGDVIPQIQNGKQTPLNIATLLGLAFQKTRQKRAEDIFLAPLGMNTDTFLAQQRESFPTLSSGGLRINFKVLKKLTWKPLSLGAMRADSTFIQ